jgi:hypothetical protein
MAPKPEYVFNANTVSNTRSIIIDTYQMTQTIKLKGDDLSILTVNDFRRGHYDVFIDTEFLEVPGEKTQLISIAMIEGDRRLYLISNQFDLELARKHRFVSAYVLPKLPPSEEWVSEDTIKTSMLDFVRSGGGGFHPRFWAWFSGLDYSVIHQMFGGINGWPDEWPMSIIDLAAVKNLIAPHMRMMSAYPTSYVGGSHDALYDALQLQAKFKDFCNKVGTLYAPDKKLGYPSRDVAPLSFNV